MLTQACVWWLHSNIWVTSSVTQGYPDALHFSIIIRATLISTARQTMLYMISPVTEELSYVLSACRMYIKLFPRFNNISEQGFFKSRLAQQLFRVNGVFVYYSLRPFRLTQYVSYFSPIMVLYTGCHKSTTG